MNLLCESYSLTFRNSVPVSIFVQGHARPVEFEDLVGNPVGGYSHMWYKRIFPTSARDFVTLSYKFKDTNGCWWTPSVSVDVPDIIPVDPKSGRIRAEVIIGGYKVEPLNEVCDPTTECFPFIVVSPNFCFVQNKCRLWFLAHADLKGSIPGFILKIFLKAQPAVVAKVGPDFFLFWR